MAVSFRADPSVDRLTTAGHPSRRQTTFIGLFCTAQLLMVVMNLGRIPVFSASDRDFPLEFNELCLGVVLVGAWMAVRSWRSIRIDGVTAAALAFALIGGGSALWSIQRFDLTPFQVLVALSYLVRWLTYFSLYVALINVLKPGDVERAWGAVEAMLVIFALFGIVQAAFLPGFAQMIGEGWDLQGHRLVSTALDPNVAGAILLIGLLVQAGRLAMNAEVKLWRMFVMLVAVSLTLSRSAAAGLIVGLAFVLAVRGLTRRLAKWGALFGSLFLVASPFLVVYAMQFQKFSFGTDSSANSRLIGWLQAIQIIIDHPVFGVGFNAYRYAVDHYGFILAGASSYGVDGGLLFVLAMTGFVGLAAYMFILWLIIARCRIVWSDRTATPAERGMALGVAASILGVVVASVFINALMIGFIMELLWVLSAFVFLSDEGRRARRASAPPSPVRLVPVAA